MGRVDAILGALLLSMGACGGSGYRFDPMAGGGGGGEPVAKGYAGDSVAAPSMRTLPDADVPRTEFSDQMKRAWLLAEEALAVEPPPAPDTSDAEGFEAWSAGALRTWMGDKSERARAARAELHLAAENSLRERIMAGALLGLVYEDVARVLVQVPVPDELLDEPEIAQMYKDVMFSHAKPFLAHAAAAYEACAGNARQTETLRSWGRYCQHRGEVLPGETIEAVPEGTGTVVTVERD